MVVFILSLLFGIFITIVGSIYMEVSRLYISKKIIVFAKYVTRVIFRANDDIDLISYRLREYNNYLIIKKYIRNTSFIFFMLGLIITFVIEKYVTNGFLSFEIDFFYKFKINSLTVVSIIELLISLPIGYFLRKLEYPTIPIDIDNRPFFLVFRGFHEEILNKSIFIDRVSGPSGDPFNDSYKINIIQDKLADNLCQYGRVLILIPDSEKEHYSESGVLGIRVDDNNWLFVINELANKANVLVVIPTISNGVLSELELIKNKKWIDKTVVIMPAEVKHNEETMRINKSKKEQWDKITKETTVQGYNFPDFSQNGMVYIPNEDFSIKKNLSTNVNKYESDVWEKIIELLGMEVLKVRNIETINEVLSKIKYPKTIYSGWK